MQLHYMDTDSFVIGVKTNDISAELQYLNELFDFSNLNKNHKLFCKAKK